MKVLDPLSVDDRVTHTKTLMTGLVTAVISDWYYWVLFDKAVRVSFVHRKYLTKETS